MGEHAAPQRVRARCHWLAWRRRWASPLELSLELSLVHRLRQPLVRLVVKRLLRHGCFQSWLGWRIGWRWRIGLRDERVSLRR